MNGKGKGLTAALLVCVFVSCRGQYTGKRIDPGRVLSGSVSMEGKPVPKGEIYLEEVVAAAKGKKGGREFHGPITNGKYTVSNLEPGKYRVSFEGFMLDTGYEGDKDPKLSTVEVTEAAQQAKDFDLQLPKRAR